MLQFFMDHYNLGSKTIQNKNTQCITFFVHLTKHKYILKSYFIRSRFREIKKYSLKCAKRSNKWDAL